MPRSSYYAIISRESEVVAKFQDMVTASSQANLWLIIQNQTAVLQKIIQESLAETTNPRVRLTIYRTLTEMQDDLIEKLRVQSRGTKVSVNDFTGPVLRLMKSRFSSGD